MNKFLISFQKSPIIAHRHLEKKNAVGPLVESHRWPNVGKLPIIQPKTTGGPTLAHRWQYLPTIRRWATGGMLSGKKLILSQGHKNRICVQSICYFAQLLLQKKHF